MKNSTQRSSAGNRSGGYVAFGILDGVRVPAPCDGRACGGWQPAESRFNLNSFRRSGFDELQDRRRAARGCEFFGRR